MSSECKKIHVCEKDYVWNLDTFNCENEKYLASIMDKIICGESIDIKETHFNEKSITCRTQNFYIIVTILLITITLLITVSIYCYLIKYPAKQKHLLPFHDTKLKTNQYSLYKLKMSNKVKDINIKNLTYYFFNDMIDIENFDPNNAKKDEKSYKNILIYSIGYVTTKESIKIYSVNPLYLISRYVSGYFEKINGNKYLTLVPTNESKEKIKKYEELWSEIRDLIRSITKNSDDYDEKYMKIKFNSDDQLSINKTIEIPTMTTVVRAVFHKNNKYYPQVLLDECLYKI